jgi:DNA-binding transcriptional regulator YiaG
MSQSQFAKAINTPVGTLRHWELTGKVPGVALVLMRAIIDDPGMVGGQ